MKKVIKTQTVHTRSGLYGEYGRIFYSDGSYCKEFSIEEMEELGCLDVLKNRDGAFPSNTYLLTIAF